MEHAVSRQRSQGRMGTQWHLNIHPQSLLMEMIKTDDASWIQCEPVDVLEKIMKRLNVSLWEGIHQLEWTASRPVCNVNWNAVSSETTWIFFITCPAVVLQDHLGSRSSTALRWCTTASYFVHKANSIQVQAHHWGMFVDWQFVAPFDYWFKAPWPGSVLLCAT